MKKLISLFNDNISLKDLYIKYQYYQELNDSLKKEFSNKKLNPYWNIITITNNELIIFAEDNLYAAKLNKILANIFDNWNYKYNHNFSSYQIKVYPNNIKKNNIKKNFYISEKSQKLLETAIKQTKRKKT